MRWSARDRLAIGADLDHDERPIADGTAQTPDLDKANAVWNAAVEAQGGRTRLLAVKNVLVATGKSEIVDLFVFPNKYWNFTDWPKPLSPVIRMEDYGTKQNYILNRGAKTADVFPVDPARLAQSLDPEGNVKWMPGSTYLLESAWWKPQIIGYRREKNLDVGEARLAGSNREYYFDPSTHLLVRRVAYEISEGGSKEKYVTSFDKYAAVGGIMFPTRVTLPGERSSVAVSITADVDYDPAIFTEAPVTKFGPDAWRRK